MRQSSEGKRNFGGLSPESLPLVFMLVVVILTVYNLFFSTFNIFNILKMQKSLHSIDKKLEEVKNKNAKLENMLDLVNKYPDTYKERFIRRYMQLQKKDEKIILFSDDAN
ncbi:FtsB family cell division protein [Hydrogenobacter hydrogenophilus]|uniref:Septum formation initiator n=1 Tax=Hydrogenobacter hydrogenophilus TaxID=35835 RepID=A0A285NME2_9AQUI|nr:septum formation initiator family protein [Hydrogenobacter hydrogenophilus]SNZ10639.1 Septum formation initiator [Hydrogenobacter hydrogenophilus]